MRASLAYLRNRRVNSITGGRLVKGTGGEEDRGARGRDREAFSNYCHKANVLLLSLNPGLIELEFNAKMNKTGTVV